MAKRRVKHDPDPPRSVDGQLRSYAYIVEAFKMELLGGKWTRYAKVTKLLRYRKEPPHEELSVDGFGETYGETTDEAISKMMRKVEEWIERQPAKPDDLR